MNDASAGRTISVRYPFDGDPAVPALSFWMNQPNNWASSIFRVRFLLSTGEYIELRWNGASYTWDAYVDNALVEAGSVGVVSNAPYHTQVWLTVADAGNINVKVDGHESINYSGDTQPGAAATISWVYLYAAFTAGAGQNIYVDDFVMGSGDYLGDLRCVDIRPTADTAQDDWTPSAGDNYSTIDETPPSDVDYNETNVDTNADELALGDFDGVTYTPRATTAWARARMEGATGDSVKVGVISNAVESVTERALGTSYEYFFHTDDQNPDGPGAWDDAAVDALLLRYEAVIA